MTPAIDRLIAHRKFALRDGEILGIDKDNCIIQWDKDAMAPYNCGEKLSEYGIHNLEESELERVKITRVQWQRACKEFDKKVRILKAQATA